MKVINTNSYDKMSLMAAEAIKQQLTMKPDSILGLATGSSPIGCYAKLVEWYNEKQISFKHAKTVNLDEYWGLAPENNQSYRFFMEKHLFNLVDINPENTNLPNGLADDYDQECARYEALIDSLGGMDLLILGIGHNGHIGFNEPDTCFHNIVHREKLKDSTIKANSRLFDNIEDVPTHAITMGIGTIMRANKIILLAGEGKEEAIHKATTGPISAVVPASVLQLHRNVTIITSF